ncbi:MAG: carbon monoxide dehydrogenase subunit G [Anderseniella sp.]
MKMTGEEVIAAPRQAVWDALNDPEILKQAITGCQEIKKKSDTEFEAKVVAKVGPVKASFIGNVKLSKLNPPRSYVITGEGKGGVAGFAKGGATVSLSDTGDSATNLSYDVDAQVGGKLAQIGSRLIDSTAKKMAADFFKKFNKIVSQGSEDTDMTKKPTAKKAAAKKPAAKKTAASAAKPAVTKAAAKKAAPKPAAKATKAAAKPAAKATKAAVKAAAKSKTAAKSAASAVSKTASAARKSAASTASAASAAASETASSVAKVANEAADEVTSAAKSAASGAGQMAETAKTNASDNIPPQVKSMSGMWTWVMLAAAAGLVLLWATGK